MTEPYIYEISPHFIHETKRKGYDVMYPPQVNKIPLIKKNE